MESSHRVASIQYVKLLNLQHINCTILESPNEYQEKLILNSVHAGSHLL